MCELSGVPLRGWGGLARPQARLVGPWTLSSVPTPAAARGVLGVSRPLGCSERVCWPSEVLGALPGPRAPVLSPHRPDVPQKRPPWARTGGSVGRGQHRGGGAPEEGAAAGLRPRALGPQLPALSSGLSLGRSRRAAGTGLQGGCVWSGLPGAGVQLGCSFCKMLPKHLALLSFKWPLSASVMVWAQRAILAGEVVQLWDANLRQMATLKSTSYEEFVWREALFFVPSLFPPLAFGIAEWGGGSP